MAAATLSPVACQAAGDRLASDEDQAQQPRLGVWWGAVPRRVHQQLPAVPPPVPVMVAVAAASAGPAAAESVGPVATQRCILLRCGFDSVAV